MDTERQLDLIKSTGSKRSHQLHQLVPEASSERGRAGRAGNMIPELEKHGPPGRNSPTLLIYLRCSSALTLMWQADAFSSQKFTSITWIKLTFSELRGESRYKTKTGHLMHKYRLKGNFFFPSLLKMCERFCARPHDSLLLALTFQWMQVCPDALRRSAVSILTCRQVIKHLIITAENIHWKKTTKKQKHPSSFS